MNLPRRIEINEYALMRFKSRKYYSGVTMQSIAKTVSEVTKIPLERIKSKSRNVPLPELRQIILYLGKEKNLGTLDFIGSYFGLPHDHVIYSIKMVNNRMDTSKEFKNLVERIKNRL